MKRLPAIPNSSVLSPCPSYYSSPPLESRLMPRAAVGFKRSLLFATNCLRQGGGKSLKRSTHIEAIDHKRPAVFVSIMPFSQYLGVPFSCFSVGFHIGEGLRIAAQPQWAPGHAAAIAMTAVSIPPGSGATLSERDRRLAARHEERRYRDA